jgi:hypothetical protein
MEKQEHYTTSLIFAALADYNVIYPTLALNLCKLNTKLFFIPYREHSALSLERSIVKCCVGKFNVIIIRKT